MEKIKKSIEDLSNYKIEGNEVKNRGGHNRTKKNEDWATGDRTAGVGCCNTRNSGTGKLEWNGCDPELAPPATNPLDFNQLRAEMELNGTFNLEYYNSLDMSDVHGV